MLLMVMGWTPHVENPHFAIRALQLDPSSLRISTEERVDHSPWGYPQESRLFVRGSMGFMATMVVEWWWFSA